MMQQIIYKSTNIFNGSLYMSKKELRWISKLSGNSNLYSNDLIEVAVYRAEVHLISADQISSEICVETTNNLGYITHGNLEKLQNNA